MRFGAGSSPPLLAVLFLLLALAAFSAHAQETNVTVTITVPGVEITAKPAVTVTAYYLNSTALKVTVTCMMYGACPDVLVTVGWNGVIYYNGTVSLGECSGSCTQSIIVSVPGGSAWVYYSYDGVEYNETIVYSVGGDAAMYVMGIALAGLLLSAAVRSDPMAAVAGLIVVSLFVYYLVIHGYAPPYVAVLTYIAVIAAVIILMLTR